MKVKRIVANVKAKNVGDAKRFYKKVLGLEQLMNLGWIATYGSNAKSIVQMSFMKEGGSGTDVPDISIEVDNVNQAYKRMKEGKFKIEYDITDEPWGVRRFFCSRPIWEASEYSLPHEGENRDILNFAARTGQLSSRLSLIHYFNPKLLPLREGRPMLELHPTCEHCNNALTREPVDPVAHQSVSNTLRTIPAEKR